MRIKIYILVVENINKNNNNNKIIIIIVESVIANYKRASWMNDEYDVIK